MLVYDVDQDFAIALYLGSSHLADATETCIYVCTHRS